MPRGGQTAPQQSLWPGKTPLLINGRQFPPCQYEILERKLTTNTVIHRHANIRKCLQYAYQIGLINSNPADRVERPKKNSFTGSAYSEDELQELFRLFRGDPLEFAVITASFYGLRRSEVVGLKWNSIDFDANTITILLFFNCLMASLALIPAMAFSSGIFSFF